MLAGLVLAGGRSSRMGVDKASLVHPDGRTLARRTCDLLREAGCEKIFISLRHDQDLPDQLADFQDLQVVRDPAEGSIGPIMGMVLAMHQLPEADWLVLACDLPRLDFATLSTIARKKQKGEKFLAYRSELDDLPEPLCAIYGPAAMVDLEAALAADFRCPRKILIRGGCRLIEPETKGALDNANTPEDWAAAIKLPEWKAELVAIWVSPGNDFRGRHQKDRLNHDVESPTEIECVAGMGLRGDRYFGFQNDFKGQVTFFDADTVDAVREEFQDPELPSSVFRRNLIVRGVRLSDWPGKKFSFQGIDFEGTEECKPCYWMDHAVAPGTEKFLKPGFGGGLRAKILTSGILKTVTSAD